MGGGREKKFVTKWMTREKRNREKAKIDKLTRVSVNTLIQGQKRIFEPGQSLTYGDKASIIMSI